MNLHANTTTAFAREWQADESPLPSCIANQSKWDGADPAPGQGQATLEAIFNALPPAMAFTDLHGEILLVNRAFTTLFRAPPQDVIGKPIDLLYAATTDGQAARCFQPHGHTGQTATPVNVRYRTHDGGTFIGETVVTAVTYGEGGRVLMDVTRRVVGMAIIFATVVILLTLLNRRDRRALRLRHMVLDQLALPGLYGRIGVHIQCAIFSQRRAVSVDLLAGTPDEVWNVLIRLASQLPPHVRLVVNGTPTAGLTRSFALRTTTGCVPSHTLRAPFVTVDGAPVYRGGRL